MVDVAAAKRMLRAERLAARRAVPAPDRAARDAAVVAVLRGLPELAGARTILLYSALPGEPDLGALIAEPLHGARVLLPRVEGDAIVPVARTPGAPLRRGALGVDEPEGPGLPLAELDAVVLPGVAFDAACRRLGRGGGHYDRLLAALAGARPVPAVAVGVADEEAVVPEVPAARHDRPVDVLVTAAAVRRRSPRAGADRP